MFKRLETEWIAFLILMAMLFTFGFAIAALAQDAPATAVVTTPEPAPVIVEPPPPNPIPNDPDLPPATTPETLLGQFYALLQDGTYIVWAAAGVVVIVGLLKILGNAVGLKIEGNSAIVLTLLVQVLIWVFYAIANYFNQGETFKAWYLNIVDVIRSLLPLAGAIFVGHMTYQAAAARHIPVLGFKPPKESPPNNRVRMQSGGEGRDWSVTPPPHQD